MNPSIYLFIYLKEILNYRMYDKNTNQTISLDQFRNMSLYNYNIMKNVMIEYNEINSSTNKNDKDSIYSLLGGYHLTNIPYVIERHTRLKRIPENIINECIKLLNDQGFVNFMNNEHYVKMKPKGLYKYINKYNYVICDEIYQNN